jgi:hypothetical protein
VIAALLAIAQATVTPTPIKPVGALSQAQFDAFSDACRAPRKWLRHLGGDEVRFKPSRRANYDKVACVLQRLRESPGAMSFGFIGNEALPSKDDHR